MVTKVNPKISFSQLEYIPNLLYKLIGFNFTDSPQKRWIQNFMSLLFTLNVLSTIFCRINMFLKLFEHFKFATIEMSLFLFFGLDANVKFFAVFFNRQRLRRICKILRELNAKESKIVEWYIHDVYRKMICFSFAYMILSFIYLMSPFIESSYKYIWELSFYGYEFSKFTYLKIIPMDYYYNYRTPGLYTCTYCMEFLTCAFTVCTDIGTDITFVFSTVQICVQLDNIARELTNYQPQRKNEYEDCKFLKEIIKKHNKILSLQGELNEIFGTSIVINLITIICVFSGTAVQLIILNIKSIEFLRLFLFFLTTLVQFHFICYYAQLLIDVGENFVKATYSQLWYNGTKEYKKILWMILMRAQTRVAFTQKTGKPLSLGTFKAALIMTYRVFALLNRVLEVPNLKANIENN